MNHHKTIFFIASLLAVSANADTKFKIRNNFSGIQASKVSISEGNFTKISLQGFETDKVVGAPALPVKSFLVKGSPSQIKVQLNVNSVRSLPDTKPFPTQEQDCRCETNTVKTFAIKNELYDKTAAPVSVSYVGAFRGTPVSRVDVRLGSYNQNKNETQIVTAADININADEFSLPRAELKDYLIIAPTNLVDGVGEFVNWRRSKGYNVFVETVTSPSNDTNAIKNLIQQYYTDKGVDFVILVGDENTIPMFKVETSGSYRTPSDLRYFTMDGPNDHIPDMFSSRIVAKTAEEVAVQLGKAIQFEDHLYQNSSGMKRFIGIASNEGSSPSDDEYVKSIENKFKETLGVSVAHFHQNDSVNSKPTVLNTAFDNGAFWLTYLGHGSGSSWPSMNQSYSISNINQIRNNPVVKPIIIDVACQNGRLMSNYLGTTFMKTETSALQNTLGAAAYFGGSVNISWHPPAVMARGIAYEHLSKKFHHLGEALLAGHLYLAANWNNQEQVIDNFEWYHLQGDPGMSIEF